VDIVAQREIAASRDRVWGVITDLDRFAVVLSAVERVERLDDGTGFGVGARWRETRTMFGKQATEDLEVVSIEPEESYTTVAESSDTTYTSVLRIEPADEDRCRLSMSFGATPSGPVGRLLGATLGRAFRGATRKMLQRDLDDIAAEAESTPDGA
jgi:carbon monoxide dehydrogenase subunit G